MNTKYAIITLIVLVIVLSFLFGFGFCSRHRAITRSPDTFSIQQKCTTSVPFDNIDPRTKRFLVKSDNEIYLLEDDLWKSEPMDHEIQKENLLLLKKLLDELRVEYYIDCGTLLGAVRDKGFIKGDHDADIMVSEAGAEIIRGHIQSLDDMGFITWRNGT